MWECRFPAMAFSLKTGYRWPPAGYPARTHVYATRTSDAAMLTQPKNLPAPVFNANAEVVLSKRYYQKDEDGKPVEDGKGMLWRVAAAIAGEEAKYERSTWKIMELARAFYQMMAEWKFLPNSPTLMNAGNNLGQLSACFVLPVGDSIEEIFDAVKYAAMIHKSGGGTGFSFSRLRPKDARVGSTGGVASGPVSFLRIFNTATEQIKQGGTRRGANMGILRVDHPDIIEFVRAKEKDGDFNNFNLSVGLTESFMQAVKNDAEYPLIVPNTGKERSRLRAREVFDLLAEKAWQSGDPGIIFLDRINRDNPTPDQGEIESTNPCGEQPLLPYEACNLGSINLARFVLPGHAEDDDPALEGVDWAGLGRVIHLCVRFLDNVIDASRFPLDLISERVRDNRKIGLGVMGWADMLYMLRIPYDSPEGIALGERVMGFLESEGRRASHQLALERGAFPAFEASVYARRGDPPLRNATITTIAPTGTLSILAGCSSGVEPLFALSFARNVMDGERLVEVNPHFGGALAELGLQSPEIMEEIAGKGSIAGIDYLPLSLRRVFVTAMDIAPEWHLRMQAAFQRHTDNAVSKTVNLPATASVDDIRAIYWMAYEEGCKGVTVYRDGSKSNQVLTTKDAARQDDAQVSKVRQRPDIVQGFTQKVQTGLGAMYLTVNEVEGEPFEVFATIGKSGRSITAKAEAIGRLVSLCLRSGVAVQDVVQQIKGIGGEHPVFRGKGLLLSIPDAISWVLENRYLKGKSSYSGASSLDRPRCPECGEALIFQEGCHVCVNCAYTKCG
jgi:ribonucleoside-diphosphate reductase alpha chain